MIDKREELIFFVVRAFIYGCLLPLSHRWCPICKKSVLWCRFSVFSVAAYFLLNVVIMFYKTCSVRHPILAKYRAVSGYLSTNYAF